MTDDQQRRPDQPSGADQPSGTDQPDEPGQPSADQPPADQPPADQPTTAWTPPPSPGQPTTAWTPPERPTPAWTEPPSGPPSAAEPLPPGTPPTSTEAPVAPLASGTGPLLSATPTPATAAGWAAPAEERREVAPGLVFSDTPSRFVAYVIDAILLGIVSSVITGALGTPASFSPTGEIQYTVTTGDIIATILSVAVSAIYFVGFWSGGRRATLGQMLLKIQVGNAFDGKPLSVEQAVKRWIGLGEFLSAFAITVAAAGVVTGIGLLWSIVLLITTATSPTKQGLHDRFANSAVVRPANAGRGAAWACLMIVIILALLALLSIVALIFLGSQVSSILSNVGESV